MARHHLLLGFTLSLILCLAAIPASAEYVYEAWRGGGFDHPASVSVNPTDGSCWVADYNNDQVVRLGADGTELLRVGGFNRPIWVSANPTDGSCWVASYLGSETVHLAEDGTELWRGGASDRPASVSVNPTDGSCWVAQEYSSDLVHLAEDGTELWRGGDFAGLSSVSVNPTDGSCWVAEWEADQVVHLTQDGTELLRVGGFSSPWRVSVNPTDGSCWMCDVGNNVVHLGEDGAELWRGGGFDQPNGVSVNPTDGSCWVSDRNNDQVVHLAEDGAELWRGGGFFRSASVSVDPTDGSCWVADYANDQVVHLVIYDGPPPTFEDVPPGFWAFDEIEACVDAGIVGGYGDGLYHPEGAVTRGQMSVFISRSMAGGADNVPDGACTEPPFTDVDCDHWARKYIAYCVDAGVVGGYLDGSYGPTGLVDRGQMSVFISRAVAGGDGNVPDGPASATFDDVPTDHWAYKYVEYCADNGIVGGYNPTTYAPGGTVTRDQMAVFICRGFDLPI
jgi:DNA-binding beta-propeller fold protein YncE